MPKIYCFLSISEDLNDKEIRTWFSFLIKDAGINPVFATHYLEPRPPKDKIMDLIQKSDIFIAVITRREKIEGKELWTGPEWIQNEIAIAHTMKKPIAIFVEDKIDISRSIGPLITDYVRFNRESLENIRVETEKFIQSLCEIVSTKIYSKDEKNKIEETIVEDTEESGIENILINMGRIIILWKYGRLDVSLKIYYTIIILLMLIPSYFIYDYFMGDKILGVWGVIISLILDILMISLISLPGNTRCRNCHSYFSERQRPILYKDIKKFPDLPKNRRLLKYECEVCGNIRYNTIEKTY